MKKIIFSILFFSFSAALFAQSTYTPCPKRIIAYFASWGDQTIKGNYGVDDIPFSKLTHINYAFAEVKSDYKIGFLDSALAIQNTYPVMMDNNLPYQGQFNQFHVAKQQNPHIKLVVSVGGWAASGGFWEMAADSVRTEIFAASCVNFLRTYEWDGIDLDWEFPTSADGVTHPKNSVMYYNQYKDVVYDNYLRLLRILRTRIDSAGQQDNKKYLLTAAGAASGWALGGMRLGEFVKQLDYLNIMSYDLHGAWNQYVGPQSALYASTDDPETAMLDQPYLNIDWAVKYYSGAIHPSKINIGIPYYSRGWKQVSGGTNGLWGTTPTSPYSWTYNVNGQNLTYTQTIGTGAGGIEGIWNDPSPEPDAGANPLWHVMNLLANPGTKSYDYLTGSPLAGNQSGLTGYSRFYDNTTKSVYVWNASKQTFLTYEDTASLRPRLDYITSRGLGGMMFWELSGDYHYNTQKGYYETGHDMTDFAYQYFSTHAPIPATGRTLPPAVSTWKYEYTGTYSHPNFTPDFKIYNLSNTAIAGAWTLEFDLPKSCRYDATWGTGTLSVIDSTHPLWTRYQIVGPSWMNIPVGGSISISGAIKLPHSGGALNVTLNGKASTFEAALSPEMNCNGSVGIAQNEEFNSFILFPNPNNGRFYLSIQDHSQSKNIEILDCVGKTIYQAILKNGENEIHLPTSISKGLYFVRIFDKQGQNTSKMIVE